MLFLMIQIAAGVTAAWASYQPVCIDVHDLESYPLNASAPHPNSLLAEKMDLLEQDDAPQDAIELVKPYKPRRNKLRYFVNQVNKQLNLATPIAFYFNCIHEQQNLIPVNKTGEYSRHRAFLPAYYNFLFRLYPF